MCVQLHGDVLLVTTFIIKHVNVSGLHKSHARILVKILDTSGFSKKHMLEQCGDHAETPTLAVIAYHFGFISSLIFSGDTHSSSVIIPKKNGTTNQCKQL